MKKRWIVLVSIVLVFALLIGCSKSQDKPKTDAKDKPSEKVESKEPVKEEKAPEKTPEKAPEKEEGKNLEVDVRIFALKGPTGMGIVGLMENTGKCPVGEPKYQVTIASKADEVTPKLIQGEADIVTVPSNLASVLYNKTEGKVQVLAINTLGVLHIVEKGETVKSVQDLKGKTILAAGKGATPEYAFRYILEKNGLKPDEDVTIEWKSEHAEVVAAMNSTEGAVALLPEPFVTTAKGKVEGLRHALDLTKEWDAVQKDEKVPSALITGVVIARKEFVDAHPEAVESFLRDYECSIKFVNENTPEAAALIGKNEIVPEKVALQAIAGCHISFIKGQEMKEKLSGYLSVLHTQNPKSVGGKLPDDAFYYQPKQQ